MISVLPTGTSGRRCLLVDWFGFDHAFVVMPGEKRREAGHSVLPNSRNGPTRAERSTTPC